LGDAEPLRSPSEMQLLGDRNEVAQFPGLDFHTVTVSIETALVLDCEAR
jgi:hypothetical protein